VETGIRSNGHAVPCASDDASMIRTAVWLEELGLGQYTKAFAEQAIDFESLRSLAQQPQRLTTPPLRRDVRSPRDAS
jgi:hypothetical protein